MRVDTRAGEVVGAPIPFSTVSGGLRDIAVRDDRVYVLREDRAQRGSIVTLDRQTREPIGEEIDVGTAPTDFELDADSIWIPAPAATTTRRQSTLTRVDLDDREVSGAAPIGPGGATSLALNGDVIWVTNARDNSVLRVRVGPSPEDSPLAVEIGCESTPTERARAYGASVADARPPDIQPQEHPDHDRERRRPGLAAAEGAAHVDRVPVGGDPGPIAVAGDEVWVGQRAVNQIQRIDPQSCLPAGVAVPVRKSRLPRSRRREPPVQRERLLQHPRSHLDRRTLDALVDTSRDPARSSWSATRSGSAAWPSRPHPLGRRRGRCERSRNRRRSGPPAARRLAARWRLSQQSVRAAVRDRGR